MWVACYEKEAIVGSAVVTTLQRVPISETHYRLKAAGGVCVCAQVLVICTPFLAEAVGVSVRMYVRSKESCG